ncbi:MAG: hypothetical protein QXT71_00845, partial [Thermoplasmata archaeon]
CGGIIDEEDVFCKICGKDVFEEENYEEVDIENEFEKEEELATYETDEDSYYMDSQKHFDLSDRFFHILLEEGWSMEDAEIGGLICAKIWEEQRPTAMESFIKGLENYQKEVENSYLERLKEENTKNAIFEELKKLIEAEKEQKNKVNEMAEIKILKENGSWIIDVVDPLAGYIIKESNKKIKIHKNYSVI